MLLKAITVMNHTLEGYASRFWKNIFRPIDLVQRVQSYLDYRYPATSAEHFSKRHFKPCQAFKDHPR